MKADWDRSQQVSPPRMKLSLMNRSPFADLVDLVALGLLVAGWLKESVDATRRSGHWIAPCHQTARQADRESCPLGRFGGRVIRTQHLRATRKRHIRASVIVAPRLFGPIVGAGSNQIPLPGEGVNLLFGAGVLFCKGGVRSSGSCICEDHPAAQRSMAFGINCLHRSLVHQKDDFTARFRKGGPATGFLPNSAPPTGLYCFEQRVIAASNLIRCNHLTC